MNASLNDLVKNTDKFYYTESEIKDLILEQEVLKNNYESCYS